MSGCLLDFAVRSHPDAEVPRDLEVVLFLDASLPGCEAMVVISFLRGPSLSLALRLFSYFLDKKLLFSRQKASRKTTKSGFSLYFYSFF